MSKSLLFLPDISGFTNFVQTTEVEHSQHVIAELLEVLIAANNINLELAEIEGDALFFYKEEDIPSQEKLLSQVESMFIAFYSHLELLKKNRICPCNACSTAPNLQLKIIAHSGVLQFITVQNNRKPFGPEVIEAHRLMKNSVDSDNYVLLSESLTKDIDLPNDYRNSLFNFEMGKNKYDGKNINYSFSIIDNNELELKPFSSGKKIQFKKRPAISIEKEFPIAATELLEYITNYTYRHQWVDGVDRIEYNEKEVTRVGSEHLCVIDGKHFNFITVTKDAKPGQLVYGEFTTNLPPVDELYQFFILTPITAHSCKLELEVHWVAKSPLKKLMLAIAVKKLFRKNLKHSIDKLYHVINHSLKTIA